MKLRRDWVILLLVFLASVVVGLVSILMSNNTLVIDFEQLHITTRTFNGHILFTALDYLRLLAVVTGIVSVYLASRENIWVWPVGIVWCLSTAWVMYQFRFFGDMALMFVYLFLQIHGWWSWTHGSEQKKELPIRWAPVRVIAIVALLVLIGMWPAKEFLELEWVHGKAPLWDSFTTAGSLGAQFLLNRKYIQNWTAWIIVDAIYIPMYYINGLPDQALLYAAFLVLAMFGLVQWVRLHRNANAIPSHVGQG